MEKIIRKLEEELIQAMVSSDVEKLDELIDDSLVFVSPGGSLASKEMDIAMHSQKVQEMEEIIPEDMQIQIHDDIAIVTVLTHIKGRYGVMDITGDYRYLRVWKKVSPIAQKYKIIAGSVTKIL